VTGYDPQTMTLTIRYGLFADAPSAITVLRRSISELCAADHGDDARELAAWLGNKTEAAWARWIARDDATVLVAGMSGEIVGVGMLDRRGEVLLNYVRPDRRFCGVSTAMLAALEGEARAQGAARCFLESTETARRFYQCRGYTAAGGACLLLEKRL